MLQVAWLPMIAKRNLERRESRLAVTAACAVLKPMWVFPNSLTPKLSRDAQWSEAHGKLYLPCGLRNEADSA